MITSQRAFTLIELMIYMAILSTTLFGLINLAFQIQMRESIISNQVEHDRNLDLEDSGFSSHLFNK